MLKRQQNMQGDELQKLDNSDQYPVKLKQLMEEVRFAKEKQMNWSERVGNEQALINRQQERIKNLEVQLEPYDGIDVAGEVRDLMDRNEVEANENSQLIQRIIDLENDKAAKVQENRLLMLKYKNMGGASSSKNNTASQPIRILREDVMGANRFDSASIDSAGVYSSIPSIHNKAPRQNGSITGRSTSSIGKLAPIKAGQFKSPGGSRILNTIDVAPRS